VAGDRAPASFRATRLIVAGAGSLLLALTPLACGGEGEATAADLDLSSTCEEFAALGDGERQAVAVRLSSRVGVPNGGNPLWATQLAARCAEDPSATLAEAFGKEGAGDADAGSPELNTDYPEGAVPLDPERVFTGEVEVNDGSTWDLRIEVGSLGAASDPESAPDAFQQLTSACEIDPQRDAVMPIRIRTVSTNAEGFDQEISTGLAFQQLPGGYDEGDLYFEVASEFSDGAQCTISQSPSRLEERVEFSDASPGEQRRHDMLLILHNYYTPAEPGGRADDISGIIAGTPVVIGAALTCFDGPNGIDGNFMLDGSPLENQTAELPAC
jgi:hypothetical protein